MAASTTIPSSNTEHGRSGGRSIFLRWVFPDSRETLLTERVVVGRDETCDAILTGNEISRRHAEFRLDGSIAAVRDLESRNGVHVNGARVADARLDEGDVVRCGEWIAVVATAGSGASSVANSRFREIAPGLFGGAKLARALDSARRLTNALPVVIQGQTGTGKEGTAHAIHDWSGRKGAFIPVNCAALPVDLAEAEFFGYRKGAFTGAEKASLGLFRAADRGSIFLDEILELPLALQAKLLRVIESQHVRPLGETQDVPIDVRVIAASQEPLRVAVADGRFRADLQARLEGLTVVLPPLRERREDVAPLFLKFLEAGGPRAAARLEARLIEALCLYDWPLNVRELSLLTQRLLGVHGDERILKRSHLPEHILARVPVGTAPSADMSGPVQKPARRKTNDEAEYEALVGAMRVEGTVAKAAAALGISRNRAYRLISARK